jgi:hypothetical protein
VIASAATMSNTTSTVSKRAPSLSLSSQIIHCSPFAVGAILWPFDLEPVLFYQVHYHKEQSWASQCRLFSQYDLIIGVHGAGLTNLICARPCAMIIEVGWTEYSFITILASHIGIHHCFANVSTTAWLTDGEGTGHPLFVSASIEPANITSCLDQFVGIHHPAPH